MALISSAGIVWAFAGGASLKELHEQFRFGLWLIAGLFALIIIIEARAAKQKQNSGGAKNTTTQVSSKTPPTLPLPLKGADESIEKFYDSQSRAVCGGGKGGGDQLANCDKIVYEAIRSNAGACCNILRVFNKVDLQASAESIPESENLRISCLTGKGIDCLKKKITAAAGHADEESGCIITSARHSESLSRAGSELADAVSIIKTEPGSMELAAVHFRAALAELESIAGETTSEEVLCEVFKRFCVGK